MFEKFKAKDALSHLGEDVDLTESALISRAKDSLLTNPEWALNAFAYAYYSQPSTNSAANLLTVCAYLDSNTAVSENTEFPNFDGQAKDALKFLEKAYIYDQLDRAEHYTALVQGFARFGSAEKALATEYNTPDEYKTTGAKYVAAILAYLAGEDVDLGFYTDLTGDQRTTLEYAFAMKNDMPIENLRSVAQTATDLDMLQEVFAALNEKGAHDAIADRADTLIDMDLSEDLYYEIVLALSRVGNEELLNKYNETFTGELYKANFDLATKGEDADLTEQARSLVQDEIDELVDSMDYQNADRLTKAFYNAQIRRAVMREAEEDAEINLLAFVPCFID